MVIRAGKHKMNQWREHEEFCLSNSLGVSAARIKLAADHFERVHWWSCGCYDGKRGRWICGFYPKKTSVYSNRNSKKKNTNNTNAEPLLKRAMTSPGGRTNKPLKSKTRRSSMYASVNSDTTSEHNTENDLLELRLHEKDPDEDKNEIVWDALTTARHFGKLPERTFFLCPCWHARNEYFEARSQLRYCTMRTGFINAHNQKMAKTGEETKCKRMHLLLLLQLLLLLLLLLLYN
jgi:hypothetical protein